MPVCAAEVRPGKEATMKSTTTSDCVNDAVFPMKKLDEKDKVLEFMRKPVPFYAMAGHFEDAITGESVGGPLMNLVSARWLAME